MPTSKLISIRDLFDRPYDVETGDRFTLVVKKLRGLRLEMEDVHFNLDSAVMLPDPRTDVTADSTDAELVTSLAVLKTCYLHAKANASQKLLILGHTDTSGQPGYNLALSLLRAKNVLAVLSGDRDGFADICGQKFKVEDYQSILKWTSDHVGWGCDPGEVDGKHGDKTSAALRTFKRRYNKDFGAKLTINGTVDPGTWKAFFDVYMLRLRALLATDDAGLSELRSGIQFVDPGKKVVGCGESHPIDQAAKDDFRSATNRRVELIFFEPGDVPKLGCHVGEETCNPGRCELYNLGFFVFDPVDPALEGQAIIRLVKLTDDEPAAGVTAIIEMPDGTTVQKVADGDGVVKLDGVLGQKFKLVGIIDDANQQQLASIDKPIAIA